MWHRKSSIVYTCNNRICKPGTSRDLAFAKSDQFSEVNLSENITFDAHEGQVTNSLIGHCSS